MSHLEHPTPFAAPTTMLQAFFKPRRVDLEETERQQLLAAERFEHSHGALGLAGWSFGSGPRVVLQHGWDSRGAHLLAFVEPLLAAGFAVTLIDAPAHGESEGESSSVVDIGNALLSLCQRLGDVQAVIAHSAGSAGSLWAFSQGLRVQASVHLCGPSSFRPMLLGAATAHGLGISAALLDWAERHLGQPISALDVENLSAGLVHSGLILHDPQDRVVPFAASQKLHSHWPGSQLVELQNLGHRRLLGDAQVVAQVVDFLTQRVVSQAH